MAFDATCKFIAEHFTKDIATWLLGKSVTLTKLEPSELSLEPIRADSVIFLESDKEILHVEFQVEPRADVPFRAADYRLRLYRRSPEKTVRQVVVYLTRSKSSLVKQEVFEISGMRHEFKVVRLWECPVEQFLELPGLLPFAALSQASDREEVLRRVAPKIEAIPDRRQQANIAASTGILAGLILDEAIIKQVLRQDIMKESVIYQEIEATGDAKGFQRGIQKERALVSRLLNRRIGSMAPELRSEVDALPIDELEDLGEALLDFKSEADLRSWLESH